MTKIMKMKKPSRASRAYKSYLIHSEKLKCVPCKKVFRSARLKRRHCVILGHTPKIVAPTFGKDYSEDEKKDRTTCMVCQESTRGKSGRVYTHLVNPREVVTCRTCIRQFHRACLEEAAIVQMQTKGFDDEPYEDNPDDLLRDLGDMLFSEATMPCCRQRVVDASARGLTGIRSKFDESWLRYAQGERQGLKEIAKDKDAARERMQEDAQNERRQQRGE